MQILVELDLLKIGVGQNKNKNLNGAWGILKFYAYWSWYYCKIKHLIKAWLISMFCFIHYRAFLSNDQFYGETNI